MDHLLLIPGCMIVAVTINNNRISPLFDVANELLLVSESGDREIDRRTVRVEKTDSVSRVKTIKELGIHVLICGAISRSSESMLLSAGIRVIPCTCGSVEEVLELFIGRQFTDQSFLMPGCCTRRNSYRNRYQEIKPERENPKRRR